MSRKPQRARHEVQRHLAVAGALVVVLTGVTPASRAAPPTPRIEVLVGQRLVVAMEGTSPSPALLERIRRGEVGGVILFGANVVDRRQLARLTTELRRAAEVGGMPRLLVAVDQEGGAVRRLRWAPPGLSARELARRRIAASHGAGLAAGRALRRAGVDVDLAPVADVPVPRSFLAAQERAFGTVPSRVAARSAAFSRGLASAGVIATAKHFPGLGRAVRTTDAHAVTIRADRPALDKRDLVPFRHLVSTGVPLVMLSNASYIAFGNLPAAWSSDVVDLLRSELGFTGATVTDSLDALALTHAVTMAEAARRAVAAGVDGLLVTGSERESAGVLDALVADARAGRLSPGVLRESYERMLVLKREAA
jgi:beta-N-acetylhexosaminidase